MQECIWNDRFYCICRVLALKIKRAVCSYKCFISVLDFFYVLQFFESRNIYIYKKKIQDFYSVYIQNAFYMCPICVN